MAHIVLLSVSGEMPAVWTGSDNPQWVCGDETQDSSLIITTVFAMLAFKKPGKLVRWVFKSQNFFAVIIMEGYNK